MDFRTDKLLHGGDYNPEQWLKRQDILEKDIDMLEESGCNVVSLGIFSWSTLEPEEGVFHFEKVLKDSGVSCGIKEEIPDALEITVRDSENEKYYIYQNFGTEAVSIPVPEGEISWIYGNGSDKLKVYGLAVAKVIV